MVGWLVSVTWRHVVPMVDHEPGCLNEIRTSARLGSLRKLKVRFAIPGATHSWQACLTRPCRVALPSRNPTVIVSPLLHLAPLTSAARSLPTDPAASANHPKHHWLSLLMGPSWLRPDVRARSPPSQEQLDDSRGSA